MTAIQPARLREQTAQLAMHFDNPQIFIRNLHELLNIYGRHVYRAGKTNIATTILPSYRVPEPVLRQIELALTPYIKSNSVAVLTLCDALWNEPFYEFRMLAARIVGKITDHPVDVLARIQNWSLQVSDKALRETLLKQGLIDVISKDPNSMINRVYQWLNSSKENDQLFGIQIIRAMLENQDFENLPPLYGLIAPFVRNAPGAYRSLIVEILLNLIHRSPNETAFFLQQNLELNIDQDTAWFIRRCIRDFPPDTQISLRNAIRKQEMS